MIGIKNLITRINIIDKKKPILTITTYLSLLWKYEFTLYETSYQGKHDIGEFWDWFELPNMNRLFNVFKEVKLTDKLIDILNETKEVCQ